QWQLSGPSACSGGCRRPQPLATRSRRPQAPLSALSGTAGCASGRLAARSDLTAVIYAVISIWQSSKGAPSPTSWHALFAPLSVSLSDIADVWPYSYPAYVHEPGYFVYKPHYVYPRYFH